jgi:ATP-dependent HslUV protease ATP-binding subunit HslU
LKVLVDEEAARLVNEDELKAKALANVEQNGIVFLDETRQDRKPLEMQGADVSRQGVQRDLLPLVEGTTVNTKYGMVKPITSCSSPRRLSLRQAERPDPELQGRFPIRVELDSLTPNDFERILTSTDACLTKQYQALLATDEVTLEFTPDGIARLAQIAYAVNERTENIGARRLYTVMEKLLEPVSFEAGSGRKEKLVIDAQYVDTRLADLAHNEDLARYVL